MIPKAICKASQSFCDVYIKLRVLCAHTNTKKGSLARGGQTK